ncbi:hypothetical protein ZIOFF_044069 [Zingiber officinale]|uniref:Protein kinase domain-containing protein n=1 Tax=Zingiber officinale TaxID=94328 RepID=A0A8J5FXV4_ZINOF|nr:hypothetical protein ZIOFF_044069 [Zingiber officinale]
MALPISSLSYRTVPLTDTNPLLGRIGSAWRIHLPPGKNRSDRRRMLSVTAALITEPDAFEVGRFVGSYGFMNITRSLIFANFVPVRFKSNSYSSFQGGFPNANSYEVPGYFPQDIDRLRVQDIGEGQVKIRLYEGRIIQGPLSGTRIIFKLVLVYDEFFFFIFCISMAFCLYNLKFTTDLMLMWIEVYPGRRTGGVEADIMATNELSTYVFLQNNPDHICPNLQLLLGGFETKTGEQWLAFRNDGKYSAADYCMRTSQKSSEENARGKFFGNPFNKEEKINQRRFFIIKLLNGAINGLAYLHNHDRLHQSLGPSSVVLNTIMEKNVAYLVPRLRDLSFAVDIRYSSLGAPESVLSEGLWRRASAAGAFTPLERRAYGIADDIYEAGLLFAYLAFVPFCEAGIIDSISLQRLFENMFQLDVLAAREYCSADDRLLEAVKFLDLGDGAGWELLQAMLNPDYRQRPIAEAVLNHRFMTAAVP